MKFNGLDIKKAVLNGLEISNMIFAGVEILKLSMDDVTSFNRTVISDKQINLSWVNPV